MTIDQHNLRRKTPVYDHAGEWLFDASREKALELISNGKVEAYGRGHRIKGLRLYGPDPSTLLVGRCWHRYELGMAHRRETYFNPKGAWHIDRIPEKLREEFGSVVSSCLTNGADA
jgi:hypothetical protein